MSEESDQENRPRKRDAPLERAIAAAGGVVALARKLGISSPAVSIWKRIPAARVSSVAAITGIPADELRPDLAATFKTTNGK